MPQCKPQIGAWIQAARPLAFVNIQLPLFFGLVAAMTQSRSPVEVWPSALLVGALMVYGLALQLFIVFLNDYADAEADALNSSRSRFAGGSRVLQEGRLERHALLVAGRWMMIPVLFCSALCTVLAGHWAPALLLCLGMLLFWAYSFPPLKLNYRGGGELLQALGCGVLLPVSSLVAVTLESMNQGWLSDIPLDSLRLFPAYFLFQLAAALSVTLPDHSADTQAGKRTLAVVLGVDKARALILLLLAAGLFSVRYLRHWTASRSGYDEGSLMEMAPVLGVLLLAVPCACQAGRSPGAARAFVALTAAAPVVHALYWCLFLGLT